MRDPAVVGRSVVVNTSLRASGTPASGPSGAPAARLAPTAGAAASAWSVPTCRNAWTCGSTAAIRSRCAWVTSCAVTSPAAMAAASSAAVIAVSSLISVHRQDPRYPEPALLGRRGLGEHGLLGQARHLDVVPEDVDHRDRVGHRGYPVGGDLLDPRDRGDDDVQLLGEVLEFSLGQGQPGQLGQVRYLVTGNRHRGNPRGCSR